MAGIRKVMWKSGPRYRVIWRGPDRKEHSETFIRKEDARRRKTEIERTLQTGAYVDPRAGSITLGEYFEKHFLVRPANPIRPSTEAIYRQLARHFGAYGERPAKIRPPRPLAERPLNKITRSDVQELLDAMLAHGTGASTVSATRRLLSAIFAYAVDMERLSVNPVTRAKAPRVQPRPARFLTAEEVDKLASTIRESDRALVLLIAFRGLRIGEALALRIGDVDFLKRRVQVARTVKEVDGKGLVVGPTKTGKIRSVALPAFLVEELSLHIARLEDKTQDALLFPAPRGGFVRENNWRKSVFYPACEQAKITPRPHVHDLRHTAASLSIAAGAHPKAIAEMLGHANITMTLDLYGHLFPSLQEREADKLDALYRSRSDPDESPLSV
jgi:integrase